MNIRDMLTSNSTLFESKVKEIWWMDGLYNFGCGMSCTPDAMMGDALDCKGSAMQVQE